MRIVWENRRMQKNNKAIIALLVVWALLVNAALGVYYNIGYAITNFFIILIVFRYSKWLASTLVIIYSVIACLLFPVVANFGKPNINMVSSLLYANNEEIWTTIKNLHLVWVLAGIITLALGLALLKYRSRWPVIRHKTALLLLVISAAGILIPPFMEDNERGFADDVKYPPFIALKKTWDAFAAIDNTNKMIALGEISKSDFRPKLINNPRYDTFIMVIDESVRRDYMQVYGAPVDDTPFLSRSAGTFFDNYVSAGFSTVPSLTHSLLKISSGELQYQNSVIRLAQAAGLETSWISNQGFYGYYDAPLAVIGKQADRAYFAKLGNAELKKYTPDSLLMPEIMKSLAAKKSKLVVIHLVGSHPDFCTRVNDRYDIKLKDVPHSCYAQSIRNTDRLLSDITAAASRAGDKWSMLYFGDHGLSHSPATGELLHRDGAKENYMPPFAVLNYDSREKKHIAALRSGFDFQSMFAQWIGVVEPLLKSDCDYFSEQACLNKARVLDGNMQLMDFSSLPSDPSRGW